MQIRIEYGLVLGLQAHLLIGMDFNTVLGSS